MIKALILFSALLVTPNLRAQPLPKTFITDVNTGKKTAFNEIVPTGKVTLITFWGTWCAHGKRQVKTISRKMEEWKKQADFNFIAIAIDQQNNEQLVQPYVHAQGWHFPCYMDANSALKQPLHFDALPYNMIIDKNGKIVYTHTGYEDEELLAKLKETSIK